MLSEALDYIVQEQGLGGESAIGVQMDYLTPASADTP